MSTEVVEWNPRYVAYAAAHGRTPDEMLAHDVEAFSGAKMLGFILWIGARWRTWRALHGYDSYTPLTEADHDDFTAFVQSWATSRAVPGGRKRK